jgi:hypothetical protein
MKTKEEIEQLAFKNYGYTLLKGSFIHGYTQCQEDVDWELLVKLSKRYTEDDMIKFANQYSSINILHLKEHLKEFTLNKQD